MADRTKIPRPRPTPETQHFWDGCNDGKIILQRCKDTGQAYFPPRPFSPFTGSRNVETFEASGKGVLWSYIISHRDHPNFDMPAPYAICVVKLDEGVQMMTNIGDCEQTPEALQLDMPVQVTFRRLTDEINLPLFKPAS